MALDAGVGTVGSCARPFRTVSCYCCQCIFSLCFLCLGPHSAFYSVKLSDMLSCLKFSRFLVYSLPINLRPLWIYCSIYGLTKLRVKKTNNKTLSYSGLQCSVTLLDFGDMTSLTNAVLKTTQCF